MAGPSRPRLPVHVTRHPGLRVTMIHRRAGWRGSRGLHAMPAHQDGRDARGQFLRERPWSHPGTGYARACKPVTEPDDHRNREKQAVR